MVNSANNSPVNPRVSMLMAICTEGKLYFALTQTNTDHKVFCLFITKLVDVLSKEDKEWRSRTVLLLDGAKY